MSEPTILEKVARALRDADAVWAARAYPEKSAEDIQRIVAEAATEMGYESMAFAAVKALLEPTTLEVQMRGAEMSDEAYANARAHIYGSNYFGAQVQALTALLLSVRQSARREEREMLSNRVATLASEVHNLAHLTDLDKGKLAAFGYVQQMIAEFAETKAPS